MPDALAAARYAAQNNEQKRRARAAARRREVVTAMNVAGGALHYAVRQLSDGIGPAEARMVALETAAELEMVAESLRRAVRLRPAERRALARFLAAQGVPTRRIAATVGVSGRSVRNYVRGRGSCGP